MNQPVEHPAEHPAVVSATALVPHLREQSEAVERGRRVPAELAHKIAAAGLFRMLMPRSLNGQEAPSDVLVRTLARLAEGDSACAWCVMTGTTTSLLAAYLEPQVAAGLWGDQPNVIMAGVFAPRGRAQVVEGGFRLSGRWSFASGCQNADWISLGALVQQGDELRRQPDGRPELRTLFVKASELTIIDTWDVMGLRGTGSHDVEVNDLFVPAEHTANMLVDAPKDSGALYRFPVFGLLASGVAAVALGIARAAIDALVTLAASKRSFNGRRGMLEQEAVQLAVARAEATHASAQQWLLQRCRETTRATESGSVTLEQRSLLRLAATHATRSAKEVVDAMYQLGGGGALYQNSPLQRHFRDIHTVTQHVMVSPATDKTTGRVLLGIETDVTQL